MNGKELFKKYTSKEAVDAEYAKLLATIAMNSNVDLFPLLEQAEAEGKKLNVDFPQEVLAGKILSDEIHSTWISIR